MPAAATGPAVRASASTRSWRQLRPSRGMAALRWGAGAFRNLRVLPPGLGICHQVNMEHLATVATTAREADGVRPIQLRAITE